MLLLMQTADISSASSLDFWSPARIIEGTPPMELRCINSETSMFQPRGPFSRLLDFSDPNISPDSLDLGLEDFSTSSAKDQDIPISICSVVQRQVHPMPSALTSPVDTLTLQSDMNKPEVALPNWWQKNPIARSPSSSSSASSTNNTLQKPSIEDGGDCTREQKRSSEQVGLTSASDASATISKKCKTETSGGPLKVRKEKLGQRINALQQLVSPYGKTDTASVLQEAMRYIKFLQEQVQVLSAPYFKGGEEETRCDLRTKGLCLVPVSCSMHVANDNAADFWTSGVASSSKFL